MSDAMDYIANLCNRRDSQEAGDSLPVRWGCLREDLRTKHMAEAKAMVAAWAEDEQRARKARERIGVPHAEA